MVFRYSGRLVISVQRYELVRKKQNNLKIFCFRGVWSEECGVRYAFKNKWFDICILYLSSILIPHSTLHTPQDSESLHRNIFQCLLQQLPEGSYGGPKGALGSGVRRLHRRTEADDIQVRVLA